MLLSILLLLLGSADPRIDDPQKSEHPSHPANEVRAAWNHSGTGAYPGDWEKSCRVLAENNFNRILPNMLWAGVAHYPSKILPRSKTFRQYGDQIQQCLDAAKKHDIDVHVWKVSYNLVTAPKDFIQKLRRTGRTQVSIDGKPRDWLCPSHPKNRKLERDSMLEVVKKYAVSGIHFDYIRYPGREYCYCAGCRKRFEADSGKRVAHWPEDCYNGPRKEEYNNWRCRQITQLVAAVSREARKIRPDIKISAAVFGAYPDCRAAVAQDWPAWIKAGYLDFVCPMDYTADDRYFQMLLKNQLRLVGGKIPVYPGIGASAARPPLSADQVTRQIHIARRLGAAGFTLFELNRTTAETLLPKLGQAQKEQRSPHGRKSFSSTAPGNILFHHVSPYTTNPNRFFTDRPPRKNVKLGGSSGYAAVLAGLVRETPPAIMRDAEDRASVRFSVDKLKLAGIRSGTVSRSMNAPDWTVFLKYRDRFGPEYFSF